MKKRIRTIRRVFQAPIACRIALRKRIKYHLEDHPGDKQARSYLKQLNKELLKEEED